MDKIIEGFYQEDIVLQGDLVALRGITVEDKEAVFETIFHNEKVLQYYVAPYLEDMQRFDLEKLLAGYRRNKLMVLAIVEKSSGKVIGMINQCNQLNIYMHYVEVGYAIAPEYWNKGYTTEALKLFINYCFEKGIYKVYACCIKENTASARVMEKAGMKYEFTSLRSMYYHDKYWDLRYYSIEKDD